ncbi:MAG: rod-binding protein [Devosia sp.]
MSSTIPLLKVDTKAPGYEKLHKQATELEGVFLNTLMKEMFSSIKTDENSFGGGFAEETWRGMQAEQFSGAMAQSGGVGLADQLMGDLLRLQESTN